MAQNIFDATFDANNRIDVNSFDWSHVNNLTTDFGYLRCCLLFLQSSLPTVSKTLNEVDFIFYILRL